MLVAMTQRIDFLDEKERSYCNTSYLSWLRRHNISTLIITDLSSLDKVVSMCDFLIIAGGWDIHPSFYGGDENEHYPHYNKEIDILDFALIKAFHHARKPILGICRGMQVINVYFQGTLYEDVPNHMQTEHPIYFHKDSQLKKIYPEYYNCNSYHHQAIDKLGSFLKIEAIAKDGIIEAISFEDYILGLEWHPEFMDKDPILLYFSLLLKNTL